MRFDDLLGDREPEAGVLAEALMRPVGVEALEDPLQRVLADAGPVIVDHDLDLAARAAADDAHLVARLGERLRVRQQVRDHLAEPARSWPGTESVSVGPRPSKRASTATSWPSLVSLATLVSVVSSRRRSTGAMSWRCNSASSRLASDMSEIRRSSRLTSCSITASSRARLFSLRASGQRLDRRAQRGQRVLQLMGDIGGEHLDRLDAAVERVGHVAQRAGEMADLVAAPGEVGNLDAGLDAVADALGAFGKPPHRACDRAREQQRQHDHDGGGDAADLEDGEALGHHQLVDVVALRRQHQCAAHGAEMLHRNGDRTR